MVPYSDMTDRQPWEREAVDGVTAAGIMRGYPDGTFQPDGLMRRVEVAAALLRLYHAAAIQPPLRETTAEMLRRVRQSVCRVGMGTGFCAAPGVIMTDWHVVRDGNVRVATLADMKRKYSADWLKLAPLLDFATVSDPLWLPPLPIATEPPQYGDTLYVIGCGPGEPGTPIRLMVGGEVLNKFPDSGSMDDRRLIACSGATQEGDSGGPVVNDRGEFISPLIANLPGDSRSYIAPLDVTTSWLRAQGYVA